MDPEAEVAQPPEGQGAPAADSPYAEYLNRIPEDVRGDVEPVFKEWDSNVTRRFQEASEYRKQWEPYEQLGVNQLAPEDVQWGLEFRKAAVENPQAVWEWAQQFAQQNGLAQPQAPESSPEVYGDPDTLSLVQQQLQQALSPVTQQLEQLAQWRAAQEQQAREADALRLIEGQMNELKAKHGDEFNREAVESFIPKYVQSDPRNAVNRAWNDYQALVNQISSSVIKSKAQAPQAAERGGVPDAAPEPIKTLADAGRIAMEQLRNARGI